MNNIFEKLNILLTESEGVSKVKESDIPIHPEMETKEQGEITAAEKILKLFQKLKAGSGSGPDTIKDSKPEIPDDMIDPMMKEPPKSSKEKTFEKNKITDWYERSEEKIKKDVEVDNGESDDDDFDDFDYRNNPFGDDDDEEDSTDQYDDDDRSEDEKLKDSIDDAIDSLSDDDDWDDSGDGDDSGADWGDDNEDGEDGDGNSQGGNSSQNNSSQSGNSQQGGDNEDGDFESGNESGKNGKSSKSSTKNGGERESISKKQKRLEDLKKSLESKDLKDFDDKIKEIKDTTDIPEDKEVPGGQIETPSDESFKDDMKKAGFDDKTIEEMTNKKNDDGSGEFSEEEIDKLKKQAIDGLEKSCKEKGGSALASSIVKNSLKRKITNEEWKEMLKVFLKAKSISSGNMSSANKGIKWGHKNHLWRDAILPTDGPSKGTIQNIYCFIDFSGSVDQDLVYTFLGKVIDMCVELKYTNVKVYGFGERLVEPRTLDKKSLKNGTDVALSQTWDFISSQNPGGATENFKSVAEEINRIKRKERDAVFLIFGDALWEDMRLGPKCLKYDIMNEKYLNDICVLAYYTNEKDWFYKTFVGVINILKEIVGIKHIITTKATSIFINK